MVIVNDHDDGIDDINGNDHHITMTWPTNILRLLEGNEKGTQFIRGIMVTWRKIFIVR